MTRHDGPRSPHFRPVPLPRDVAGGPGPDARMSRQMAAHLHHAPAGPCTAWGIPFDVWGAVVVADEAVTIPVEPVVARWLVFLHTSDLRPAGPGPARGEGQLGEHAADYVVVYADGSELRTPIRRRHQVGAFQRRWGENCFEAVADHKPQPSYDTEIPGWGRKQIRVTEEDGGPWVNWIWAWENPGPEKEIVALRCEPGNGLLLLLGVSAGSTPTLPLRWRPRRSAVLTIPDSTPLRHGAREHDVRGLVQLDMGQIIACVPRPLYPHDGWADPGTSPLPRIGTHQVIVDYASHADACFHLEGGETIPVARVEAGMAGPVFEAIAPARQRVTIRAEVAGAPGPTPVRLHVHGEAGEYLAPIDRNRYPNPSWFEDYSVDSVHYHVHHATYIRGEATVNLPLGRVYVEVSKGFEFEPVRRVFEINEETREIVIVLEKALPWREMGWVTADTHVHFLSPATAHLEGAAEGVNVINLLASQWGELMTNVGDFDGKNTWGSRECGGDGEYLVRVGTENRQHVLGHISLLGYRGALIAPMAVGGPDESAIGDPVEVLLTEWARQCRGQGGLVVLPHFPDPRAEHAATIVDGSVDAVEMTSFGDLYGGLDPYSLADWYRYLNCGYPVPVVGGTDKMSAATPVGAVRTYARIAPSGAFSYEEWQESVRRGHTFVTYGPLLVFEVDGQPMGSRIELAADGGTVDVTWRVASVTTPMTRVELVVNGETRESVAVSPREGSGHWSVKLDRTSWIALLVRGVFPAHDVPFPFLDPWLKLLAARRPSPASEIIAAHSSAVMVHIPGRPLFTRADAVTILEQIEGALAYVDTIGTRADDLSYKRMRLLLEGVHQRLHQRLHEHGVYHEHAPGKGHAAHE